MDARGRARSRFRSRARRVEWIRRPPGNSLVLVLAFAVGACGRGGVAEPALWVGEGGAPRILSFTSPTAGPTLAAGPPALDAPVRALLVRRDGSVVALQEPEGATSAVVFRPRRLSARAGGSRRSRRRTARASGCSTGRPSIRRCRGRPRRTSRAGCG